MKHHQRILNVINTKIVNIFDLCINRIEFLNFKLKKDSPVVVSYSTARLNSSNSPTSVTSAIEILPNISKHNLPLHKQNLTRHKSNSLKIVRYDNEARNKKRETVRQTNAAVVRPTSNIRYFTDIKIIYFLINLILISISSNVKVFKERIKASTIDNYSRIVFPIVFVVFNLIYWAYYMSLTYSVKDED